MPDSETDHYLALLRGINLGGKNMVPMRELSKLCEEAGCTNVRTYIQSGNVLFTATPEVARELPAGLATRILARFSLHVPVVIRTAAELRAVHRENPFLAQGADAQTLHVMFLADRPEPGRVAALDPDRSSPDAFIVSGREIYLWLPNGVARSKLTNAYFDAKLDTTSTSRNWRTVTKLLEMLDEVGSRQ